MHFTLSPDGKPSRAEVTTPRWVGTPFAACLTARLDSLVMPAFDGPTQGVAYAIDPVNRSRARPSEPVDRDSR